MSTSSFLLSSFHKIISMALLVVLTKRLREILSVLEAVSSWSLSQRILVRSPSFLWFLCQVSLCCDRRWWDSCLRDMSFVAWFFVPFLCFRGWFFIGLWFFFLQGEFNKDFDFSIIFYFFPFVFFIEDVYFPVV